MKNDDLELLGETYKLSGYGMFFLMTGMLFWFFLILTLIIRGVFSFLV